MSTDLGTLEAEVRLDTSWFRRGIKKIKDGFSEVGQKAMHLNQSLELVGRGFRMLDKAIKGSLGTFIEAADTAEKYRVTLDILLGSASEGARMFDEMSEFASGVPFEYEKIMSSATALSGVMNGGVNEVKQWMPMIADLAAVSRLSIEDTTSQMIKMYSAGASAADSFRERGITAMLGFTAGVKYTAKETREKLQEAYSLPTSKFKGAATELAKTWSGLTSMMADRWFLFRTQVMQGGLFESMKQMLRDILEMLDRFAKDGTLEQWAHKTAQGFATSINFMVQSVSFFIKSWYALRASMAGVAQFAYIVSEKILMVFAKMSDRLQTKINDLIKIINVGNRLLRRDEIEEVNFTSLWNGAEDARRKANIWGGMKDEAMSAIAAVAAGFDRVSVKLQKKSKAASATLTDPLKRAGVLSGEASKAVDSLQKQIDDLSFQNSIVGLDDHEKAIKSVQNEIGNLREEYNDLFEEAPGIENMLEKLEKLKLASIEANEGVKIKDIQEKQSDQYEDFAQLSDNTPIGAYQSGLHEVNKQHKTMIEEGGKVAGFADMWKENETALLKYKTMVQTVGDVTNSMVGAMTDALMEFAETGKMSLKGLGATLVKELKMYAARNTAQLLMEGLKHEVLAIASLATGDGKFALHQAAANSAFIGAASMGSFVLGSGLAGMAHSGISEIPEDGTWLLKKKERVVDAETNQDLKAFIKEGGSNTIQQNITIKGGDEEGVKKTLPLIKQMAIDAVNESISSRGSTFKTIQAYT